MSELVAEQFDDLEQQTEAGTLGMWTFLATEVLFFGGMICGYTVYRHLYFPAWHNASLIVDNFRFLGVSSGPGTRRCCSPAASPSPSACVR